MQRLATLGLLFTAACIGEIEGAGPVEPDLGGPEVIEDPGDLPAAEPPAPVVDATLTYTRLSGPTRTAVYDANGTWLATFTLHARTVRLRGPRRTFRDPDATATVSTNNWVRLLAAPWDGTVDEAWLRAALADGSPDILAVATEYTTGGRADAGYGPMVDGVRLEGSDFNDYLGMDWTFATGYLDQADPERRGMLDCSGFQRMVWGYRGGIELALKAREDGSALPRTSADIFGAGPGVITVADQGAQVTDLERVFAGDLVFFDAEADDAGAIDHVGLYLGVDSDGHHRFVSSRKVADGPTFGDLGGRSTLDGDGTYATSFRAARRL